MTFAGVGFTLFMNAGIPMISELSKAVGKSETEIKEMVSEGKIGFAEVQAVIKNMTDEGGTFYNLMDAQSKSLGGQISNLKDNFAQVLNEIGKATEGIASGAISSVAFLVENYQTLGKVIAGLIATYGAYKTAILVNSAIVAVNAEITKGWTIAQLAQYRGLLLLEKAQKLLNATMLSNPYVLVATAVMGLVSAYVFLREATDADTEATKRHNELREEQANKIDEERNRINKLIATIQDETKSWNERNKAFLELQKTTNGVLDKYTSLNQVLREMSQVLKELNGRYETMNEGLSRDAVKNTEDTIKQKEAQIERLKAEMKTTAKRDHRVALQMDINDIKRSIEADKILRKKQLKVVVKNDVANYESNLSGRSLEQIQAEKKLINEAYNLRKKQAKEAVSNLSVSKIDSNNPYLKYDWEELGMYNEATERQIKLKQQEKVQTTDFIAKKEEILALQNKINEAESKNKNSRSVDNKDLSDLEAKKTKLKGLIDEYKQGTGIDLSQKNTPKSKAAKSERPTFDQEAHLLQTTRLAIDNELAQQKANIEQMQEGYEKELALVRYYYDEKAEAIRRGGEDARIALEKERADSKGLMSDATYNARLNAINENEIIANEQNSALKIQQEQKLLDGLLEKYQTYTDQRKAIEEKYNADIAALQAKLGAEAPQVKKAQDEKARELKKLDILYKKEGTAIAKLFENMRKKTVKEIRETIADAEKEIDALASILDMSDKDNVEFIQNLKQQLEQARDTADRSDTVFGRLGKNIQALFKFKPNTIEWKEALQGVLSDAQSITGEFGQLGDEFERLGQNTGNEGLKKTGESIKDFSNIVSKTVSFAQIGGSVGSGWGAAIGGVIGAVYGIYEKIGRDREQARQAERQWKEEQIQFEKKLNDLYDERILKGQKFINAFTENKIGKQIDVIKNYKDKIDGLRKKLIDVQNSQVISHYDKKWVTDKALGFIPLGAHQESIARTKAFKDKYQKLVDDFGNIDFEFLERLNENDFGAYASRIGLGTAEIDEGLRKVISDAKEVNNKLKEYREEIDKYTKETFGPLGANFSDSIISAVEKGESAFENFGQTVSRVMKNVIKQTLVTQNIKNLFDDFDKAVGDIYTKGIGLSNEQLYENVKNKTIEFVNNTLKPEIQKGEQKAKAMFDALEQSGIKMYDDKGIGRQAVEKGYMRLSQDTGDELLGQQRLLTELQKQTKDGILQAIEYYKGFTNSFETLKNNLAQQLQHLAGIEANTYKLNKMETDLASLKRGMDELTTRGIKIRS